MDSLTTIDRDSHAEDDVVTVAPVATRPTLADLIARYGAAAAALYSFTEQEYEPGEERARVAVEALPHIELAHTLNLAGKPTKLSTANRVFVETVRMIVDDWTKAKPVRPEPAEFAAYRDLIAAAEERAAAVARLEIDLGTEALRERAEDLSDAVSDAEDVVLSYPVTDLAELQRKVAFVTSISHQDNWQERHCKAIGADIARLTAGPMPRFGRRGIERRPIVHGTKNAGGFEFEEAIFELPAPPRGMSPQVAETVGRYVQKVEFATAGDLSDEVMEQVTDEIHVLGDQLAALPTINAADHAAKMLVAIHDIAPEYRPGGLHIDAADFNCPFGGELLIAALYDAMDDALFGASHTEAWDAALAEYRRLDAIEVAMPMGTPGEDDALDACTAAFDALMALPASSGEQLAIKIEMATVRYPEAAWPDGLAASFANEARRLGAACACPLA